MTSYYPEGTRTDEDAFTGPEAQTQPVECEAEEGMSVVPSSVVKSVLRDLVETLRLLQDRPIPVAMLALSDVEEQAQSILDEVESLEDVGSWTCTFSGDVEVVRSGADDAAWTCPTCGSEQGTRWDEYTREDLESDRAERAYEEARGK